MGTTWAEAELQSHITNSIEESLTLDYKAADALAKSDGKKNEITKDVSAMANSAGGTIIYGLKEHPTERHKAERIDPIDRTQFSKEWLEHVINNIRPRISGIIIHPVTLSSGPNDVAYVVEIPQSNTAHQANDKRYYKRFNFESVPMEDFEIRDIMNRVGVPCASVRFGFRRASSVGDRISYILLPLVKNSGTNVIKDFKLTFTFPRMAAPGGSLIHSSPNIHIRFKNSDYFIDYHSAGVLFPDEERNIGEEIQWKYEIDKGLCQRLEQLKASGTEVMIPWTLYADNMSPKSGSVPLQDLHDNKP